MTAPTAAETQEKRNRLLMRTLLRMLILFPVMFAGGGCATTFVWANAREKTCYDPQFVGLIRGLDGDKLLFQYDCSLFLPNISRRQVNYFATIQLDNDGLPPEPFAYRGEGKTPSEIDAHLSLEQAEKVRQARFDLKADPKQALNLYSGEWLKKSQVVLFAIPLNPKNDSTSVRVLMPPEQPRPSGEIQRATAIAAFLTPLTVIFDAVTFPAQALYAVTHR